MLLRIAAAAFGLVGLIGATCLVAPEVIGAPPVVKIYGPTGSAPAFIEAAEIFAKKKGGRVDVIPTSAPGIAQAVNDADLIFDDGETALGDLGLPGTLAARPISPLYARAANVLVRSGNPQNIASVGDLARPGTNIMVVSGSASPLKVAAPSSPSEATLLLAIGDNVVAIAKDRDEAERLWASNADIDVWLHWGAGKVEDSEIADIAGGLPESLYRTTNVLITGQGESKPLAHTFVAFLASKEGSSIFAKWGWPFIAAE